MPVAGTETLLTAADALDSTSARLREHRDAVASRVGGVLSGWSGAPAPLARARLGKDVADLLRAADACRVLVPALRAWADELYYAQADLAEGERLVAAAQTRASALAPGDVRAHQRAQHDIDTGSALMIDAEQRAAVAEQTAARAFEQATGMLAGIAPPAAPGPALAPDGHLGDGLRKAGQDVIGEIGDVLGGLLDHVNVFSERFDDTWSETARTTAAAVTHPLEAARAVVEGTVAPIGESYRSGRVDEAIGRTPGVIASVLGGKGLTKLGKLDTLDLPRPPEPGPRMPVAPGGGLARHEQLGGHTLDPDKAHVGATDQELLDRQTRGHPGPASSYTDRATAERAIHENMAANKAAIDTWLRDPNGRNPRGFDHQHEGVVGRSAPPQADLSQITSVSTSKVVLHKDPNAPDGYYILTSYPEP